MMIIYGLVDESCRSHCIIMCSRVCTLVWLHKQLVDKLGKNLWWYSLMGTWPMVMQVNWAYRVLVKPMDRNHDPSLA